MLLASENDIIYMILICVDGTAAEVQKMSKRVLIIMMALVMVFSSFNTQTVYAGEAVKPDVPKFKVKVSEDESLFTFTISKTSNADGYRMLNRYNDYPKDERTFDPLLLLGDAQRTLMDMDICGVKTKVGIPTLEMLTSKTYGFSGLKSADKSRIVSPSKFYDIVTNHNATRHGLKLFGCYWVANEKAGETICVDQNGKILVGEFDCNVYEIGVVNVIKVDLKLCNIINK